MNRGELRRSAINVLGGDLSYWDDATLNTELNRSYMTLANRLNNRVDSYYMADVALALTAGVGTVNLPAGAAESPDAIHLYRDETSLTFLPLALHPRGLTLGSPLVWGMNGRRLTFYPVPEKDETLLFRGSVLPSAMTADTDEPVFPLAFHDLIAVHAGAMLAGYVNDPQSQLMREFETRWLQMIDTLVPGSERYSDLEAMGVLSV